jgi:hypothetical protein
MAEHVPVGFDTAQADKGDLCAVTDAPVELQHAVTDARLEKLHLTAESVLKVDCDYDLHGLASGRIGAARREEEMGATVRTAPRSRRGQLTCIHQTHCPTVDVFGRL